MKKIISVFLALCLSATVMCSCSTPQTSEISQNSQNSETAEISSEETQSSENNSDVFGDISQNSDKQSGNSTSGESSKTPQTSQTSQKPSANTSNTTSNITSNTQDNTSNNTSTKPNNNNTSNTTNNTPNNNNTSNTTNNTQNNNNTSNTTNNTQNNNNTSNTTNNTQNNNNTSNNTNNNQNNNTSNNTNTSSAEQEAIYKSLFDINSKVSIKIDISDAELLKIQKDYDKYHNMHSKSPIYRVASKVTFTINGKKYEIDDVGIRMKGNTTRESFYNSSSGMYNLVHFRLSFDETFDDKIYYGSQARNWNDADRKQRKKRTFATLNGLEIKWNVNYDQTYVREYYTSQMYRENGILCARNSISQINIAGRDMGVYMIYEPVDKNFIERNLPEKDWGGDLYKAGWTNSPADYTRNVSYGIEDEDKGKFYNFDLKTNKKTSTHQSLKNLLNTMNKSVVTKTDFEKVIDKDYWIKYSALSYFIGSPDDLRNNYNNHYVYFRKSDGKAIFIPYDNDRSFGICCGFNPTGNGMTTVSPFSTKAEGSHPDQKNPIVKKSVQNGGYYISEYKTELNKIASSKWVTFSNFKAIYEIAKSHYNDCTKPDKYYQNADSSRLTFSLDGKCVSGDTYNLSVEDYFTRKLNTYNRYK
ncbi:MAG: CotH kinase family protein [Clostridia bacterium]|nr:CotH kinase family protein [Clostridia bacterium]